MFGLPLAAVIFLLGPDVPPSTDAVAAAHSRSDADALTRKLADLEIRRQNGRLAKSPAVRVTEAELNAYLNLNASTTLPPGVSDVVVRVDKGDRVHVRGIVDLDRLKGRAPAQGSFSPMSFLGGRVPLEIAGRVPNGDGFGSIEVEEVLLSGMALPLTMVEQIVVSATKNAKNPEGFDIHAPFRLPWSVKRVRFERSEAWLEF